MATLTIYADTADGEIQSGSETYSEARAGTGPLLTAASTGTLRLLGQQNDGAKIPNYYDWELFFSFDSTGSLSAGDTVTAVDLMVCAGNDFSGTEFIVEARTHGWGASLTTADWVAGASLSGKTLQASVDTTGGGWGPINTYVTLTSEAGFPAAVVKNGVTYLMLSSSRQRVGNTPTANEYVQAYMSEQAGTDKDPKLVVTYTPGGAGARSRAQII